MDFELLLVILTVLTGAVWVWDRWVRDREDRPRDEDPWYIDLPRSLFPIILAVLVIRSFVVEPFRIPSGSMMPTLQAGDFILVNKFSYGVRLPVLRTRFLGGATPERGDVAVFRYPVDPSQDYIKRVVGLPGDDIRYENRQLFINGVPVAQDVVGRYDGLDADGRAEVRRERLDEAAYDILIHSNSPGGAFYYTVPEGHYFVLGDNRDRSADSRMWGPVADELLAGRAFLIWMSWDARENRVVWDRIGDRIE